MILIRSGWGFIFRWSDSEPNPVLLNKCLLNQIQIQSDPDSPHPDSEPWLPGHRQRGWYPGGPGRARSPPLPVDCR